MKSCSYYCHLECSAWGAGLECIFRDADMLSMEDILSWREP